MKNRNEEDDRQSKKQRSEDEEVFSRSNTNVDRRNLNTASMAQTEQSRLDDTNEDHGNNQSNNVERKRVREQKRRSDITSAIDLLVQVLLQVDMPIVPSETHDNQNFPSGLFLDHATKVAHGSTGSNTSSRISRPATHQLPYNRSEIISYAKQVLEKIHQENVALKHEIESLKNQLPTQLPIRADHNASSGALPVSNNRDRSNIPVSVPQESSAQYPINQLLASFLTILLSNGQSSVPHAADTSIPSSSYYSQSQYLPSLTQQGSTVSSSFQSSRALNSTNVPSAHSSNTQLYPQSSYDNHLSRGRGSVPMGDHEQVNTPYQQRHAAPNQSFAASEAAIQPFLSLFSSPLFQSLPIDQQIALFNQILQNNDGESQSGTQEEDENNKVGSDQTYQRK